MAFKVPQGLRLSTYPQTKTSIVKSRGFFINLPKQKTMKQKIYISGKITGLTPEEAFNLFNNAEIYLKEKGFEVINPMTIPHDHDKTWLNYMRNDLKALLDCDALFMLYNWKDSKGAKVEHDLAESLGLEIIYN